MWNKIVGFCFVNKTRVKQIEDYNDKIEVVPIWKWLLSF